MADSASLNTMPFADKGQPVANGALLAAYLRRIGLDEAPAPDASGLAQLQQAHRLNIGFENIDIMLGRPVHIDPGAIVAKLVEGGRGGYCFEHNALFGAVLAGLGLANRALLGRVWLGAQGAAGEAPPRTHTLRLVEIDGAPWIADAGFGGSYVPPLPLVDGAQAITPDGARHRLRQVGHMGAIGGAWLLERAGAGKATDGRAGVAMGAQPEWLAQYSFDLGEVAPVDLEMSNHWTSTRAETRFTSGVVASIVLPDGFAALTGRRLTMSSRGRSDVLEIATPSDWRSVLADLFRIELSAQDVGALALF
ncbi:MAG TPA: arylamine N-acetyltransferase [Novosphingobium sp.]|nr:arylamine N-acetyltransferase [Novosphingobium sp.]